MPSLFPVSQTIRVPSGINFECTGCGNCCLQWPVPVTATDRNRLLSFADEGSSELATSAASFFPLPLGSARKLAQFSYYLSKRGDGRCEFLDSNNRCRIHEKFGADAKPSMCSLFPYTFTVTPTGVYASVSFASTGVLQNSGRALAEQLTALDEKLALFKTLFSVAPEQWLNLQLVDGVGMSWEAFLSVEESFLDSWHTLTGPPENKLLNLSARLAEAIIGGPLLESAPPVEAAPEVVDMLLLDLLSRYYLPKNVYSESTTDFDIKRFAEKLVYVPSELAVRVLDYEYKSWVQLPVTKGDQSPHIDDLLDRFLYCKLFSKLYFGPGFANFSVVAGLHHLFFIACLIRRAVAPLVTGKTSLLEVGEIVRCVEMRLTDAIYSPATTAVLEVLLSSPERAHRVGFLSK